MLQSRITLMDEIKTFLCGHILLLVQVLRKHIFILYHYFQFLLGSWEGRGGGRISRGGSLLTCPVHVLLHIPFAKLEKYWEGFQLRRRQQGQKGNKISSWSLCLSFCVKNPGMFLFFGKWQRWNVFCGDHKYAFGWLSVNTPVCRVWQVHASFFKNI